MNKTKVHLGVIQETLLITLWARYCELQAADPIIVDPKSSEILAALPFLLSETLCVACFHLRGACRRQVVRVAVGIADKVN
jgi:O-methyltransferase involved in polyketide biosynthesis